MCGFSDALGRVLGLVSCTRCEATVTLKKMMGIIWTAVNILCLFLLIFPLLIVGHSKPLSRKSKVKRFLMISCFYFFQIALFHLLTSNGYEVNTWLPKQTTAFMFVQMFLGPVTCFIALLLSITIYHKPPTNFEN